MEKNTLDATILFADMVDSSMISHIYDPQQYDKLVSTFQDTCAEVVTEMLNELNEDDQSTLCMEPAVRGDELSLILYCPKQEKRESEIEDTLCRCTRLVQQTSIRLKRRWLLVDENKKRVMNDQPPLGIAIGLHAGPVVVGPHVRFNIGRKVSPPNDDNKTAEGYALNIAKRVETASRTGRFSRIFLTRPIYNRTPADFRQAFVRVDVPEMKGIPVAPIVYEAKGIGHFDDKAFPKSPEFTEEENLYIYEKVVERNPDLIWLLLDLAHKYFDDGEYDKAAEKYRLVIESDAKFAPAYAYLGRARFRNYYFQEAYAALEQAIDLDRDQARSSHYFAVCLRRHALFALHKEQEEDRARDFLQQAIRYHEGACRIAELENMDFPWARNGLNWTIGECEEFQGLSVPYDVNTALKRSRTLRDSVKASREWKSKIHLISHTIGFLNLKQKQYNEAVHWLNQAMVELEERRSDPESAPDSKGFAERKSEILYHLGLCEYHRIGERIDKAIQMWQEAKAEIEKAWPHDKTRACEGQY